jgi:hypothetical protein
VVFHPIRCELIYSGLTWYPVYRMEMWIVWNSTSCAEWECGWFKKVPGVRNGLWLVPGVRNGIVDGLKRYLVYGMRLWMAWKGAQSMVGLMIFSIIGG